MGRNGAAPPRARTHPADAWTPCRPRRGARDTAAARANRGSRRRPRAFRLAHNLNAHGGVKAAGKNMKRTVSRRGFLQLAGSVGGSTAVYRAAMALGLMSTAHATRPQIAALGKPKKVLILGAGISGLTAAYELSRKGYE